MWQFPKSRIPFGGGLFLAWLLAGLPSLQAQGLDPVEDLKQALPMRLEDLADPTPEVVKFRRDTLEKKVAALKTIPHLRRALALEEWKDTSDRVLNPDLQKIDAELRGQIAQRLIGALREVIKSGDANSRLAVANLIGEMGPTVRALEKEGKGGEAPAGFAASLTPEVVELTRDKDLAVRQEALRALGNINAPAVEAAKVFQNVLKNGDSLGPRRLAADGLGQMMRVVNHLHKRGRTTTGIEASLKEVVVSAQEVIRASLTGMEDEDPQVRALCLVAFQTAAQALAEQVPDPFPRKDFPPEGREWSAEEKAIITKRMEITRAEIEEVNAGIQAIRAQVKSVVKHIHDPHPLVRYKAILALDSTANLRLRMKRRLLSVPAVVFEKGKGGKDASAYLKKVDPLIEVLESDLPTIARLLAEPDIHLRRSTLDFLELLEADAAPLQPQVMAVLSDPNRFVRWSAVRILGNFPPEKAASAVPQLAGLLADMDLNIRMAAAQTLEWIGPHASAAAPALARAVGEGDVEARIMAMYVLNRLGPDAAAAALPQLIDGLNHPDPRLRRAITDSLGRMGPGARPAIPALRRALGDEDAEVRINASDAILSINGPVVK